MSERETRAVGVALALACAAAGAPAQDVHKCTINGAVTYQAMPCPSGDAVLPAATTPSEQESRQARSDLWRQRMQAATGRIMRPSYVPPPPPPPAVLTTTTTTTIFLSPGVVHRGVIVRQTRSSTAPPPRPLNNCEKLNQDNDDALDRREQLRTPSELASHEEMLRRTEAEVSRIAQLATASNCRLQR